MKPIMCTNKNLCDHFLLLLLLLFIGRIIFTMVRITTKVRIWLLYILNLDSNPHIYLFIYLLIQVKVKYFLFFFIFVLSLTTTDNIITNVPKQTKIS